MKYVLDSHTHTLASGHAYHTIQEMADAAAEKGLELLGITDHSMKMPGSPHEFYFANMRVLSREISGIEVMFGAEVNIMDYEGNLDMEPDLLEKMDVVIASLHIPCIAPGTREQNTKAFLGAMKNPCVNIIGHPDDSRYPADYEALVLGAKEHGVLIEINNSSLHPDGVRQDPVPNDMEILKYCKKYGQPIILNSDAHAKEDVGNHCFVDSLLKAAEFPEELVVNRSVEKYKKYINRYK